MCRSGREWRVFLSPVEGPAGRILLHRADLNKYYLGYINKPTLSLSLDYIYVRFLSILLADQRSTTPKQVQLSFTQMSTWGQSLSGLTTGAEPFPPTQPPPPPVVAPPPVVIPSLLRRQHKAVASERWWRMAIGDVIFRKTAAICYLSLLRDELLNALWAHPLEIRVAVDWLQRERQLG